jgi:hypothetical protein
MPNPEITENATISSYESTLCAASVEAVRPSTPPIAMTLPI